MRTGEKGDQVVLGFCGVTLFLLGFLSTAWLTEAAGESTSVPARRVLHEGFEDGKFEDSFPVDKRYWKNEGGWRVVSKADGAEPHSGGKCLRGNFCPGVTDSITRLKTTSKGGGANIDLRGLGITDELYMSAWWRLDADVKFECAEKGPGAFAGYKLNYICGTARPWARSLNWVIGQPYRPDQWWLVDNNPQPQNNSGYHLTVRTDAAAGRPGVWHHLEFYLGLNSAPRKPDGIFIIKVDGKTCVHKKDVPFRPYEMENFRSTSFPSMFGGAKAPSASFGWQLDDLEIWDGMPTPEQLEAKAGSEGQETQGR